MSRSQGKSAHFKGCRRSREFNHERVGGAAGGGNEVVGAGNIANQSAGINAMNLEAAALTVVPSQHA